MCHVFIKMALLETDDKSFWLCRNNVWFLWIQKRYIHLCTVAQKPFPIIPPCLIQNLMYINTLK